MERMNHQWVLQDYLLLDFILNKYLGYQYRIYLHFCCLWCSLSHLRSLLHMKMFQAHGDNLKYARNTWTFSVMVVKQNLWNL